MNLELDILFSEALDEGEHLHLDFEGHVIDVTVGKVSHLSQKMKLFLSGVVKIRNDPTLINWGMRVNYARRVLNNLQLIGYLV